VAEHNEDLTNEELIDLQSALEDDLEKQTLSDEITEEQQPSSGIREMLKAWESVEAYLQKYHPNKLETIRSTDLLNDTVSHFRQILKRRQKQTTSDSFLIKKN